MNHTLSSLPRNGRRGAMLVLVSITIILLVIAVAFSVDVAYMQLTRTELRTSTDAAARAGIEALSRTQDLDAARAAARNAASVNSVAGAPLLLDDADMIFGRSTRGLNGVFNFNAGDPDVNSIRVIGRRTGDSPSGPVGLLFAGVLGPTTFLPTQTARAVHLDRDICVVLDRSGSMNWGVLGNTTPEGRPWCDGPHDTDSRWAALHRAMNLFLGLLDGTDDEELVGIASYSSNGTQCGVTYTAGRLDVPLQTDYMPILNRLDEYSGTAEAGTLTNFRVSGATDIASGINEGVNVVTDPARRRPFAEPTLIVLTDGVANVPSEAAAAINTRAAAQAGKDAFPRLVIHTITFSAAANQTLMQEVAAIGGGSHFHAPTAERLEEIFEEIALTLPVVLTE